MPRLSLFWLIFLPSLQTIVCSADSLVIKPSVCVIGEQDQHCESLINISWKMAKPRDVCLFYDGSDEPLSCWKNKARGEYNFTLKTERDTDIYLADALSQERLASTSFQLVFQQKRYRAVRRNPWNFF